MATILGNLWDFNLAKLVVVDVSDDYRWMGAPLPHEWYPVLREVWVPAWDIEDRLATIDLVEGYYYDWHQSPDSSDGAWYVGVVSRDLLDASALGR
ncbi:MAG: hypothetical protein KF884_08480 [Fimbriimonadaceae bacterium]|nr:hypothetical protein [Fimbriimonadaceae bacterium]QYK57585.1 MAG: hypothetical protein KF884_08480 [Fimbriimonadaceae bacterium]